MALNLNSAGEMSLSVGGDVVGENKTTTLSINPQAIAKEVVNNQEITSTIDPDKLQEIESMIKLLLVNKQDNDVQAVEKSIIDLGKYLGDIPFLGKILSHVLIRL